MSDEPSSRSRHPRDAELMQRRAELLTDAAFTRSVLANSTEAICVLDLDARIELMSVGALRAMAITDEDDAIATFWLALWHDDARPQAAAAIAEAKAGRAGVFEGTHTADGQTGWWEVTVSPILGADGRTARLLAIARDITARRIAHQTQQMLMQEMHHRVKNMLAMVIGITAQSLARAPSIAEGRAAVERRLMALAEAHNVLRDGEADGTSLHRIVESAVAPCDAHPSRIDVSGPDIRLSPPAALAVAMALHELCTNAVKHGALSAAAGRVEIAWRIDATAQRFHLTWRESGGPTVRAPDRRGFGSRVIETSFRHQAGGRAEAAFEPSGVVWSLDVPLAALQDVEPREG